MLQIFLGTVALAVSYLPAIAPSARALGILAGGLTAALQSIGMMAGLEFHERSLGAPPEAHFPTTLTVVMLVGMAVLPIKPVHALGLGSAILGVLTIVILTARGPGGLGGWAGFPLVLSVLIVFISTGLTAVIYHQRATAFLARRRAEEAFEALTKSQANLLVERNAASQSHFAAALSHELNTPLGSLRSAFETLVKLMETIDPGPAADPKKRWALAESLRSGRASLQRLEEITRRMRRLTNLDRAEERLVDLNELCADTVAFLESDLELARVEMDFSPVPKIPCRPQQIGAVLSNLLRNAAAAIDDTGRIEIASRERGGEIWIEVRDDGHGIEPERLASLFEPSFRVAGSRVATSNWGLFVSRSIVSEHGGRLEIESEPGKGTTARMALPLLGRAGLYGSALSGLHS